MTDWFTPGLTPPCLPNAGPAPTKITCEHSADRTTIICSGWNPVGPEEAEWFVENFVLWITCDRLFLAAWSVLADRPHRHQLSGRYRTPGRPAPSGRPQRDASGETLADQSLCWRPRWITLTDPTSASETELRQRLDGTAQ